MSASATYELYLTDEAADAFDAMPIAVDAVEYYDSGVWVTHADGRDFFPYERVVRIRERPAGSAPEESATDETDVGERRDAAGATAEAVDDPDGSE
jgi:hypothetical protein